MYVSKVIERSGNAETAAKSIDELCNKMDRDGYELVTYQFCADNKKIILTFRKRLKKNFL